MDRTNHIAETTKGEEILPERTRNNYHTPIDITTIANLSPTITPHTISLWHHTTEIPRRPTLERFSLIHYDLIVEEGTEIVDDLHWRRLDGANNEHTTSVNATSKPQFLRFSFHPTTPQPTKFSLLYLSTSYRVRRSSKSPEPNAQAAHCIKVSRPPRTRITREHFTLGFKGEERCRIGFDMKDFSLVEF